MNKVIGGVLSVFLILTIGFILTYSAIPNGKEKKTILILTLVSIGALFVMIVITFLCKIPVKEENNDPESAVSESEDYS